MLDTTTPVGRIVWGSPLEGRPKTDMNTNQPVLDAAGQPVTQWAFGLAIVKDQFAELWGQMYQEAQTLFPQGMPSNFAYKFVDGDGMDKGDAQRGRAPTPYSQREGYAGCYVLSISTEAFAPRVVQHQSGAYVDMLSGVKTGDYVRVALRVKAHAGKPNVRGSVPGLYLNPSLIEFVGYGEAIVTGPDPMAVFGGQQVALPPGASPTPVAPSTPMPQGTPQMPAQQAPAPVQPAYDFVQGATGGQPLPGMPGHNPGNQ